MIFDKEDLRLYEYQYQIRHTDGKLFKVGEAVFLKSNPEIPMKIKSVSGKNITAIWYSSDGELQTMNLPPECILQYKYAGLLIANKKFNVCLN